MRNCLSKGPWSIFWFSGAEVYNQWGARGMLLWKILKVRASEITRNVFISINPEKCLLNFYAHSMKQSWNADSEGHTLHFIQ